MAKQPEQILENQLIVQLQKMGYGLVLLKDETDLIYNLKTQVEKHNNNFKNGLLQGMCLLAQKL